MRRARFEPLCACMATLIGAGTAALARAPGTAIVVHAARLLEVDSGRLLAPAEVLIADDISVVEHLVFVMIRWRDCRVCRRGAVVAANATDGNDQWCASPRGGLVPAQHLSGGPFATRQGRSCQICAYLTPPREAQEAAEPGDYTCATISDAPRQPTRRAGTRPIGSFGPGQGGFWCHPSSG
jgi:hypothetical protein